MNESTALHVEHSSVQSPPLRTTISSASLCSFDRIHQPALITDVEDLRKDPGYPDPLRELGGPVPASQDMPSAKPHNPSGQGVAEDHPMNSASAMMPTSGDTQQQYENDISSPLVQDVQSCR